ncbi:Catechol 1,2-dioxygenase [Tolypocladium paradoxum]|uniref:Catechol 1,2-dioxygenase n=1 Tax=Tolypocladium paradoxum TaxID=94208 RepID=A0A2S4L7R1_9HYPO|nr:Catechol 1,2-dioxygenase [Tolypocladium paradoxum]
MSELNTRGHAYENGKYWLYCYHPTAYSLPTDGPAYDLLKLMVTHPDFKGCTTQLYPKNDLWLVTDTVFAVKDDLVVDFKPLEGDDKAELELEYNVILSPKGYKGRQRMASRARKADGQERSKKKLLLAFDCPHLRQELEKVEMNVHVHAL